MDIKAYAKINLTLEVLGYRPDGYHEVNTVLQTVDLSDRLYFSGAPKLEFECSVPELEGENNLVWKAAETLRRLTGCDKGAKIHLEKHIPAGMGLGGGSSDAAATLGALVYLWELDIRDQELRSIAASLGSDVPFFLQGGTALGKGRGESIAGLTPIPQQWIVLVCPSLRYVGPAGARSQKTARLYSMLTEEHYTSGERTVKLVETMGNGRVSGESLYNVFEQVAPSAFHGFGQTRQDFLDAGAQGVHLSGTGPGLYTLTPSKEDGEGLLEALKRKGLAAYGLSTVQPTLPSPRNLE